MKYLTLFAIACINLVSVQAKAQDFKEFKILAFDGSNQKVSLVYDDVHELLKLSLPNDTLYIPGAVNLDTAFNLNKQFLQVNYSVRGGTGLNLKYALLLSVKSNKLVQSLHITSVFDEEFIDFSKKVDTSDPVDRKTVYECKLIISGKDAHDYKLNVQIHEEKKLKQFPSQNSISNRTLTLNFDPDKNVFLSSTEDVSQYFDVFDEKTLSQRKQYFLGKLPFVKLGQFRYYYMNSLWYDNQEPGYLVKYAYH